jgi:hypothetical protein
MTVIKTYYPHGRPLNTAHRAARSNRGNRWDERGEGVISAAIAVLIMAFIGVGMWVAFNNIFEHTATNVDNQVNKCIGQTNASC